MFRLHLGDCVDVMRTMPNNCVDSIVTDPPYELGFMGKSWDNSGIANSVEMWREALRVLKPGGHLLAFSGSRTYHRMTCAIEDAGFEVRDQIMWIYGSGFPKSHNGTWGGTALKPAHEPICVARKPLAGTVATNVRVHGTGGLNIDACRVGDSGGCAGAGAGAGARVFGNGLNGTFAQPVDGLGRWPANLIHDGSDEVLAAFPDAKGQQADVKYDAEQRKTGNVYGAMKRGHEPSVDSDNKGAVGFKMKPGARRLDAGSAARFFYCAKTSKSDRNEGLDNFIPTATTDGRAIAADNAYQRGKTERANTHPTVKPTDLMRYLCRLITPSGGLVLDPFMGSGSTGKAAILEGFRFVGIDMTPEYHAIAQTRIEHALFGGLV